MLAPATPTGLGATAGDASVSLDWNDNGEGDLASYSVYRSTNSGSYVAALTNGLSTSDYIDSTAVNGTTYGCKLCSKRVCDQFSRGRDIDDSGCIKLHTLALGASWFQMWWSHTRRQKLVCLQHIPCPDGRHDRLLRAQR